MVEEKNTIFKELLAWDKAPAPKTRYRTGLFVGCCEVCGKNVYDDENLLLLPSSNNVFVNEVLVCSKNCGCDHYSYLMYDYKAFLRNIDFSKKKVRK